MHEGLYTKFHRISSPDRRSVRTPRTTRVRCSLSYKQKQTTLRKPLPSMYQTNWHRDSRPTTQWDCLPTIRAVTPPREDHSMVHGLSTASPGLHYSRSVQQKLSSQRVGPFKVVKPSANKSVDLNYHLLLGSTP